MTARVRSFILIIGAFVSGLSVSWVLSHRPFTGSLGLIQACSEMAQEVSDKCHEAERRRVVFEKKFPESRDAKKTDAALRSPEWERSASWAQACDDAKTQLEEAILDSAGDPSQ